MSDKKTSLQLVELYHRSNLICLVPKLKGSEESIRIFSQLKLGSVLSKNDIAKVLELHLASLEQPQPHDKVFLRQIIELLRALQTKDGLEIKKLYTSPGLLQAVVDGNASKEQKQEAVGLLDQGKIRCARKIHTLQGIKRWVPQSYAIATVRAAYTAFDYETCFADVSHPIFWDKIPLKTAKWSIEDYKVAKIRFLPGSIVRYGAYIGPSTIIAGLVNIGAHLEGEQTMIDFGARVATGAQVGKHVKVGAGSGIEGINEPTGRIPSVIEDNVIIGANCEISGIVEEGAILGNGVIMAPGKRIFDLRIQQEVDPISIQYNGKEIKLPRIPEKRIAVPGFYQKKGTDFGMSCILLLDKDANSSHIERRINSSMYR